MGCLAGVAGSGLIYLAEKFNFEDEALNKFKEDFIQYIWDFWINGCLPPIVWSVFGRSDDLTNNNLVSNEIIFNE